MSEFAIPTIPLEFRKSKAVTLGVFDGVHSGHRKILKRLRELDPENGLVITFKTHPDELLFGRRVRWICSYEERLALLKEAGAAHVLEWSFDEQLMNISAEDFVARYFLEELDQPHLVVGYDLRFGKGAKGSYTFLKDNYADKLKLSYIEGVEFEREIVSSSRIREEVLLGDLPRAEKMLERPFSTSGLVIEGFQRGRKLGFPTANIKPHKDIILPPYGVYRVLAHCEGVAHNAVCNLGLRPTFVEDDTPLLEVHLFDFEGDLYGKEMKIEWKNFIRPEKHFSGPEDLVVQIKKDVKEARRGSA